MSTEITKEVLYKLGFGAINESSGVSAYLDFPEPLKGKFFIKFEEAQNVIPNGWTIYIDFNYGGRFAIKWPGNIQSINNFYFGVCDKNLF